MVMYKPTQGDIIYLDFDPKAGHEQGGRRPALVVSNAKFNYYTNMAIVCPITNTNRNFPLHVPLDDRTNTTGFILCEQIKSLDMEVRKAEYKETISNDILQEVLERLILSIKQI